MSELSERLSQSAARYAKRALDAYLADNLEDFGYLDIPSVV